MEDRFRKIVLQQVKLIVAQEPCGESLVQLLQLAETGGFSISDAQVKQKREKAYRSLRRLIHPDKHPSDNEITLLFQNVQSFYDECCKELSNKSQKKRRATSSPTSTNLPVEFHVNDKWAFLDVHHPVLLSDSKEHVARTMAYKCINYRGTIAHGKKTERTYDDHNVCLDTNETVQGVFQSHGGAKVLETVDDIKQELIENGPVVSSSFFLCEAFFNAFKYNAAFARALVGDKHPVLIVGWKLSFFGEMWLVRSVKDSHRDIMIAMNQMRIDDECWAPVNKFDQIPWQDDSKVLDYSMVFGDWYSWSSMKLHYENLSELSGLLSKLGCGICAASTNKTRFLLRDKEKIARSRWAYLQEISWHEELQHWEVTVGFSE